MWEQQSRPWFISRLIRKHCDGWLVVPTFLCPFTSQHSLVWAGIGMTSYAVAAICKCYMQNSTRADQWYSSAQTCVGDEVSSSVPQTHPHVHPVILPRPLITHGDALEEKRCVCRIDERHTWGSEERAVCVCACLCAMAAHFGVYESSLKLFETAHQSRIRI